MKELKFRIYSHDMERMYTVVGILKKSVIVKFSEFFEDEVSLEDKNYSPIMQYVGIKDKDGKEIYEGDIVEVSVPNTWKVTGKNNVSVVEFSKRALAYGVRLEYTDEYSNPKKNSRFFPLNSKCKVIGNIYEREFTK